MRRYIVWVAYVTAGGLSRHTKWPPFWFYPKLLKIIKKRWKLKIFVPRDVKYDIIKHWATFGEQFVLFRLTLFRLGFFGLVGPRPHLLTPRIIKL